MKRRRLAVLVPIALALTLLTPGTAHAAVGAAVTGSGTISPGLSATPTAQTIVTFTGTAIGTFNNTPGSCTISFTGSSQGNPETVTSGAGGGTATCTGAGVNCTSNLTYSRTGFVVTVSGTMTCNGATCRITGVFVFTPRSIPITSYDLVGVIVCT